MAFEIVSEEYKTNQKFKTTRRNICFKLTNIPEHVENPEVWVKSGIKDIVAHIVDDVDPEDRVGFTFGSECFTTGDTYISFKKARNITFEEVWDLLGKIYQSNSEGFHSDTLRISMTQVKPYTGAGRVRNYNTFEEECANRKGIVAINNNDNLCLPRALVVGRAYAIKSPFTEQIRKNRNKMQDTETFNLLQEIRVQVPQCGAGVEELKKFQAHMNDFKITVYAYGSKGRTVLFEGPDATYKINLLHHNNHYNVINNLKAAFCCNYYCETCHTPTNNKNDHRCGRTCPCCQQAPPCEKATNITCDDCHRAFRGKTCYNKHKAPNSYGKTTLCQQVKQCVDCLKTVSAGRQHTCGEVYCKICGNHQPAGHYCFIKPDSRKPPLEGILFIFYDLESRQDETGRNGEKIHVPNLCVYQQRCSTCIDKGNEVIVCQICGVRRQVLKGDSIIPSFMQHILTIRKKFNRIIVMAHNGKSYDHQFILKHVLENTDLKADLIMRGTSIIMMGINNIKFIDSINYFPMALAALPKAFDLGPELKKGYFPHLFNTPANTTYSGPMPDIKYYNPDQMSEDIRLKLMGWYNEHVGHDFNMQRDLVEYCISDVDILTKACLKFRKLFLEECNVCPFTEACTIASACNLVYRRNFLKPKTIGILPRRGYRNVDKQSKIATLWLIHEECQRGINIIHAAKQREALVSGLKVDGYCEETRQIFEFHGCYYHGHTCITVRRDEPTHEDPSDTLNNRLQRTIKKVERLKQRGYEVVEIWECEFREMLQRNKVLSKKLENNPLMSCLPLEPRDSFYGGRTGNCCTYYQIKPGEKIKYVDVCSLYPWVCKYGKFPVGHPKVHVGEACQKLEIKQTEGLIKCKILPPQQLYHPVLPQKMNEKLMFALCRTCCMTLNQGECHHSNEERVLTGTWVIDEVCKALEKGYTILEVYEVWEYATEQYESNKKAAGLFNEMMDKFLKMKQQASGWPADCTTDELKNAYVEEFLCKEDIKMNFAEIQKNPGLRSLAKLMLNSFWGKFGQRENQSRTTIVRQPTELEDLMTNPAITVNHIGDVNKNTLIVVWEYKNDAAESHAAVNVGIAAYTTAQARLKLYSYLEQLGDRVLYYDTDSVIYISKDDVPDVPTGSSLGEMTDELSDYGPGSYIVAFASGGPKNYSYIIFSPKYHTYFTVCKVKGIKLNYNVLKLVNFYSMSQMVTAREPTEPPLHITTMNIRRAKYHQVLTKEEKKIYRPKSEKRKFDNNFNSTPYGYKKLCTPDDDK